MDFSELAKVSVIFNELLEFLKTIIVYCDILKEIKTKREHIRGQANVMEQCINVLQSLNIERNKGEVDLLDLRQRHSDALTEKMRMENLLFETHKRLVGYQLSPFGLMK